MLASLAVVAQPAAARSLEPEAPVPYPAAAAAAGAREFRLLQERCQQVGQYQQIDADLQAILKATAKKAAAVGCTVVEERATAALRPPDPDPDKAANKVDG